MKGWCREYGKSCNDKNCPYEHLNEAPECCNAILEFERTKHFGMCELDEGHTGNHRALMFEWQGKEITKCHDSYRLRGGNLLKLKIDESINNKPD